MNWYSKGKIWALLNASGFPLYLRCVADVHLWDKAWKRGRVHACVYWLKCVFKPSLSVFVHTHVCLFAHTCLLIWSKMKDCSSTDREMEERRGVGLWSEMNYWHNAPKNPLALELNPLIYMHTENGVCPDSAIRTQFRRESFISLQSSEPLFFLGWVSRRLWDPGIKLRNQTQHSALWLQSLGES